MTVYNRPLKLILINLSGIIVDWYIVPKYNTVGCLTPEKAAARDEFTLAGPPVRCCGIIMVLDKAEWYLLLLPLFENQLLLVLSDQRVPSSFCRTLSDPMISGG